MIKAVSGTSNHISLMIFVANASKNQNHKGAAKEKAKNVNLAIGERMANRIKMVAFLSIVSAAKNEKPSE
jgi:hypothetical protein